MPAASASPRRRTVRLRADERGWLRWHAGLGVGDLHDHQRRPGRALRSSHAVNDNGGSVAGAWTMNVTWARAQVAFPGSETGTTVTVDAGSFGVAESGGPSATSDQRGAGAGLGESATTITNDDQAALTVIKHVATTAAARGRERPTMNVTATNRAPRSPDPSRGDDLLNAGIYSVTESGGPAGYQRQRPRLHGHRSRRRTATCTLVNDDLLGPSRLLRRQHPQQHERRG